MPKLLPGIQKTFPSVSHRQFLQILSLAILLADWMAFYRWGIGLLPLWRMKAAHCAYLSMLAIWVGGSWQYRHRIAHGFDSDDAWYDYVIAILLGSAICGIALKWLENPFADEGRRYLALSMSTGYLALAAMLTLRPPGKAPRGMAATITPVVQLPAMLFFQVTEKNYLSVSMVCSLFIFAALMLGIREYIQGVADQSHAQLMQAQENLAASEKARRKLEVANAVEVERERLMSEVHDGIGSSLVAALAVARREDHPQQTIELLRRAVSDLKVTVDSLDPLGGDVLALMGNVRHRLEPDLTRAGLEVRWDVQNCPSLDWLDPTNALQFLRIIQEAVSNVLSHSGATEIRFSCHPKPRDQREGLEIVIGDNGCGMDSTYSGRLAGHGLHNMRARAETLGGAFICESAPSQGCRIILWLPQDRRRETRTG